MTIGAREVWITGVGAVTGAGIGASALDRLVAAGRSAIAARPELAGRLAAAAPPLPRSRLTRRLERSAALFVHAAEEAWSDAGLDGSALDADRCGVFEGSSLGPMVAIANVARRDRAARAHPGTLLRLMPGAGGVTVAGAHGIRGPVLHLAAASVSGLCALGEAARRIASGELDLAMAGGAEAPIDPDVVAHFEAAGLLGTSCRPFDADRDGTVLGEGAGVWMLEAAEHAARRGAVGYATIGGYGQAAETYDPVRPDPAGSAVAVAVRAAVNGTPPERIGWIKAHGTGTRLGDPAEIAGLTEALGVHLAAVPVGSLKPIVGHCLGASGAVEGVAAVLALRRGLIPSTIGTSRIDPACAAARIALEPVPLTAPGALLVAESFGGRAVAMVIERAEGTTR